MLASFGGYYAVSYIPDSAKEKFVSAVGLEGKSFGIVNPAAKREKIIKNLEDNFSKLEELQTASKESENSDQIINEADAVIAESKNLLAEIKELNPKTGVLSSVVSKILGVDQKNQDQQVNADQVTPEVKEQICK